MTIVLLRTLAVAFAAFCIWLTVRVINRRERWAKWTAILLVVVIAYPLSHGPARWLLVKAGHPSWLTTTCVIV